MGGIVRGALPPDPENLRGDDFARLATAALLLGRRNDCVQAMQRAYQVNVAAGRTAAADPVRATGWR